jgi:outer membrane usher protein
VTTRQPFYATSTLLSPGLQTLSVQVGAVRLNWGEVSNSYGKLAGTATYRRGLTRALTIEGSAEGTPGTIMSGGGLVFGVGRLGSLSASIAGSAGSGSTGGQASLGVQRIGRVFSLGGSATLAARNYRDVAAMNGEAVPRRQLNASTGFSLKRLGSAGAAYGVLDRDAAFGPVRRYTAKAEHAHLVSANYSFSFHRMSIYLTEFRDLAADNGGGFQAGLVMPFQSRSSADISVASGVTAQVQVQQAAATIHDWGYQAYVSTGETTREFAQVQYKSPWALLTLGADQTDGQTEARFETQGALSLADGGLFPSNTIYDSFGIVDTGPMTHVHVLQENRDVGTTGSSGRLLVPDMRSFEVNHIAIEPTDIPADATLDVTSREVRPSDRSGVVIRFAVKYNHAALLRLVDEAGAPIPLGSTATLEATGIAVPVGYEGEAYVQTLSLHNTVIVDRPDGRSCDVDFNYLAVSGDIPVIGPLRCVEAKTGWRP